MKIYQVRKQYVDHRATGSRLVERRTDETYWFKTGRMARIPGDPIDGNCGDDAACDGMHLAITHLFACANGCAGSRVPHGEHAHL